MQRLARHYTAVRDAHPHDRLVVVFDIDGTVLDMRHMVRHVLASYDLAHGTGHFAGLAVDDVDVHENDVEALLVARGLPAATRRRILDWYHARRWQPETVRQAHAAYPDVMAVIRWFQIQPGTSVALNTGRPEALRADTLASLTALGAWHRVRFRADLLHMNQGGWEGDVPAAKAAGLRALAAAGYRTVAVVDNEPDVLDALARADGSGEVLFLHARTLYESRRSPPPGTPAGDRYDLPALIGERDLPEHVELVWHGVNDRANLRHFLASPVRWGEADVRLADGRLVLRHDPVDRGAPGGPDQLTVEDLLGEGGAAGKGLKLDVKERGALDPLLAAVRAAGVPDDALWFNGRVGVLGEDGLARVRRARPGATLQCPIDGLAPLVLSQPRRARARLDALAAMGVDRFSIAWPTGDAAALLDRMDRWGHDVNIYAVQTLDDFLRAVVLLPRSVTADFNFPEWHYFGRGAGQGGRYHRYHLDPARVVADVA